MENWDIRDCMAAIFLFFYLGIPAFAIFTHRWFVVIDGEKVERRKAKDIIKYFPLVKEWLNFPESESLVYDHSHREFLLGVAPDSRRQLSDAILILNALLPECYQISSGWRDTDFNNFMILFQEYQKALSCEFFDSSFLFSAHYKNYFSRKNKKENIFHTEILEETWDRRGRDVERNIFFSETLHDFIYSALGYPQHAENSFFVYNNGEECLSDVGQTVFKVYLSTLLAKEKLGYTCFRTIISDVESMLKTARR